MTHRLVLVHLDPAHWRDQVDLFHQTVRPLRPLEREVITELLAKHADGGRIENPSFNDRPAEDHGSWLVVPLHDGWYCRAAVEFAVELKRRTGCLVIDLLHRWHYEDPTVLLH